MLGGMKVLVIGSGGREHALAWKFSQDRDPPELFCAPGNAGTATFCRNVAIKADDIQGLCEWARTNRPDLVVVGPEVPLCAGIADRLQFLGVAVFGPRQDAARLEGSKIFSKDVMESAGVPTARSCRFRDSRSALDYLKTLPPRVVVKADGLAAGKGVVVAERHAEAEQAIHDMLDGRMFGDAGTEILVEEFLEGEEASILALVDGNRAVLLPASQDHKRVGDGDTGPNTGGMGAYSPAPVVTPALRPLIEEQVFNPMLRELSRRGIRYQGVLYAGLMIGPQGIKVLEFNCRFGDPETQAVLPRLDGDLVPLLQSCVTGTLQAGQVKQRSQACVCVVTTAGGYPGHYAKGTPIDGLAAAARIPGVVVFHAGTELKDGRVVTSGGRVLGVTALGDTLQVAVSRAYEAVTAVRFDGMHYRRDIAARALNRKPA